MKCNMEEISLTMSLSVRIVILSSDHVVWILYFIQKNSYQVGLSLSLFTFGLC